MVDSLSRWDAVPVEAIADGHRRVLAADGRPYPPAVWRALLYTCLTWRTGLALDADLRAVTSPLFGAAGELAGVAVERNPAPTPRQETPGRSWDSQALLARAVIHSVNAHMTALTVLPQMLEEDAGGADADATIGTVTKASLIEDSQALRLDAKAVVDYLSDLGQAHGVCLPGLAEVDLGVLVKEASPTVDPRIEPGAWKVLAREDAVTRQLHALLGWAGSHSLRGVRLGAPNAAAARWFALEPEGWVQVTVEVGEGSLAPLPPALDSPWRPYVTRSTDFKQGIDLPVTAGVAAAYGAHTWAFDHSDGGTTIVQVWPLATDGAPTSE